MAGVGLLALLDDIASILDDVSLLTQITAKNTAGMLDDVSALTKVAAQKTAGVLGDDLALNAEQVSGVKSDRELPVVFSVFKGSLLNKAILVPAAIAISAFAPRLVTLLLMIGGAYLCFEGAEKLLRRFFSGRGKAQQEEKKLRSPEDARAEEKRKIRGAVRTDFILSAEIIVIALGTVPGDASLALRAAVLSAVGILMTVGVYGLVAAIVRLDDMGLYLLRKHPADGLGKTLGSFLLGLSPRLMRLLGVAGTLAMFLVGGGILMHGLPWLHPLSGVFSALPLPGVWNLFLNIGIGAVAGALIAALLLPISALLRRLRGTSQ